MVAVLALPLRTSRIGPAREVEREAPGALPRGRLIELSGGPDGARSSAAVQILLESQREGDPVAWIQPRGAPLYPPDLSAAGLDLDGLLVVHVPERAGPAGLPKAAELVMRSGAFGAVVLDVGEADDGRRLPRGEAWLGRLASLARERDCRCVVLGPRPERSLGPLVAVRFGPRRRRVRPGRHAIDATILKDKSGTRPGLPGPRRWVGPEGMP